MRIDLLLKDIPGVSVNERFGAAEITSIAHDSRTVTKGALFVAVEGYESDGHRFIEAAVESGAAAVAVSESRFDEFAELADRGIAVISSPDNRVLLSGASSAFYGHPSKKMKVVGVTGTNGKTSITYMLESILRAAGMNPGVIGTVNYRWNGRLLSAPNTTPESLELQRLLHDMLADGVDCVVMEVSSHALALSRADHIDFDCALFTNLTGDHLDFHKDMESYFLAKRRLFEILGAGTKPGRAGAVNIDDEYGRRLLASGKDFACPVKGFGLGADADFMPAENSVVNKINGVKYILARPEEGIEISLTLAGRFHVYNSLAAVAAARSLGINFDIIQKGLAGLETVPGRFDVLDSGRGFSAVVDYAHTGDALLKLLQSVREVAQKKIITVFGCGGDRDKTKRPVMGKIAADLSDLVIVTSDNPRTEEPQSIINDILPGLGVKPREVIADREHAIARAVELAEEGDIIVVAGKGHEDYQILGKTKIHFDDKEMLRKYFQAGALK